MTSGEVASLLSLLGAGLLAGEEFVVRYGVRAPVARLDQLPQVQLRQDLIRRLRILVPAIYFPTLLAGLAAPALTGFGPALLVRCAALVALLVWVAVTLGGTVPINAQVLEWEATAPPGDWMELIRRWERLDTIRTWAALAAFLLLLAAQSV